MAGVVVIMMVKNAWLTLAALSTLPSNAADHNYFARRALDVMTAIASGFGLFSAMIFLVTMI